MNTTDSAVRITHLPTGLVVSMQDERSPRSRTARALGAAREALRARARKATGGAGEREALADRLGRTRREDPTYNFPENRVTDHRVKVTLHRLDAVLGGELDEFTEALSAEERRRALEPEPV